MKKGGVDHGCPRQERLEEGGVRPASSGCGVQDGARREGGSKKAHVSPGLRRGEGPQFKPQVRKPDSERTRELESHIVLINRTVICQ